MICNMIMKSRNVKEAEKKEFTPPPKPSLVASYIRPNELVKKMYFYPCGPPLEK